MNKLIIKAIGLILIVGIISVGCDSMVDGDLALNESQIESKIAENQSAMHGAVITSPTAGEVVYENSLTLTANDPNIENATANDVHWALVAETDNDPRPCTGDIKFNRVNHPYTFSEDGYFEAKVDLQDLEAGEYCFVFNTELENPDDGERVVHYFYIVDEYAKVGGTIGMGEAGRGNSPTHAFEGLIGNAGGAGIVGEVSINFRQLGETCTFTPGGLALRDAPAIVEGDNVRADLGGGSDLGGDDWINSCGGTAHIILLDRDAGAMADNDGESYPRGAVVVDASDGIYSIESYPTPRWVGLERGNIHVGIR